MRSKIESILIIGGGSSGWMTGAALVKQLPNIKVTLVESPNISTIGVGESTLGHINQYLHLIGLKDKDWMKACNATYKTSIKFTNFRENPTKKPHVFHYPFGRFDFTDKPRGLMDWFIYKAKHPETPSENFAEFFHDMVLMTDANKMTLNLGGEIRNFNHFSDTAYHMDAALFGNYLRDSVCLPNGLEHILATVTKINQDSMGDISSITTDIGNLEADLYIDCTGFKSLLLDETLNVPFVSFHDTLHNDRAIATCIPYVDIEKEMECVTNCTAIESGWVWNIPLWNRIGTGYVYSSKFATEEQALEQFKKHLKSDVMICSDEQRVDEANFRFIKIKHGVHKRAWEKNVVAVGLSNGFIEPLESTGLMLTHEAIIKLVNVLKMRNGNVTKFDIDSFNYSLFDQVLDFKNFISSHYALSMRNDSDYWKEVSQNTIYSDKMNDYEPSLEINQCINLANMNLKDRTYPNNMSGSAYIAAGMGYNPTDNSRVDFLDKIYMELPNFYDHVYEEWLKHKEEVLITIDKLPTHYEFLKETIYGDS